MKPGVGQGAFVVAAFSLLLGAPAPATADTASEIRALKARLLKLEAQEAQARREAKARAAAERAAPQHASAAPAAGAPPAPQHWYERLSFRGYTQMRYNDTINGNPWNDVYSPGDRSVGPRRNFLLRRARLIFSGDVSSHLYLYLQMDLASNPAGTFGNGYTAGANPIYAAYNPQIGIYTNAPGNFAQMRDAYADISIDEKKEFRFRVGQSKIPYGFENMQSSQNRLSLDRADAINSCCRDERDLGVFFYYTPEHVRHLLRDLVRNNLKGSGDYGMFALGVYNGQGANRIDLNNGVHVVSRLTYPYVLPNGQIIEASIQGYTGRYMPTTAAITPSAGMATGWAGFRPPGYPGVGVPFVNAPGYFDGARNGILGSFGPGGTGWNWGCVNGCQGLKDDRVAVTGVIYPQPFGLKAEWNWGRGPVLDWTQTYIKTGGLNGGYIEATYKYDDKEYGLGTFFPFVKWQYFNGGYKTEVNAPLARIHELDVGVEWQPLPEVEVTAVYSKMHRTNTGAAPYRQFSADLLRAQLQWNY